MNQSFHSIVQVLHGYNPRLLLAIAVGLLLLGLLIWWLIRRNRPSAEELERRRRERLALMGRITDGHLLDAHSLAGEESTSATPEVLVYSYRSAGVTYNCAQDVSMLPELVRGYRIDQPLQVKYDLHNPGDSIVVSETWSGLWSLEPKQHSQRNARIAG